MGHNTEAKQLTIEQIEKSVLKYFGITIHEIGIARKKAQTEKRYIAIYFMRQYGHSMQSIADHYCYHTHSTVIYALRTIKGYLDFDVIMQTKIKSIQKQIQNDYHYTFYFTANSNSLGGQGQEVAQKLQRKSCDNSNKNKIQHLQGNEDFLWLRRARLQAHTANRSESISNI